MSTSLKKEALLDVAEKLFYEYGFRGVGLKQIIREANVANMTLYNHFSSKEQLVEEVLKQRAILVVLGRSCARRKRDPFSFRCRSPWKVVKRRVL